MSWIDFKQLRQELNFVELLHYYEVEFKTKRDRATAFCPLPEHNGKRRSPSMNFELKRNLFHCFGCGAKGNILEFACLMENVDPQNARDFHRVAGMLQERLLGSHKARLASARRSQEDKMNFDAPARLKQPEPATRQRGSPSVTTSPRGQPPQSVMINAPLDFILKNLDPEHPYLAGRGFTPETIQHFGLGFCNRGTFKERLAIPLHDPVGKLIGYAGRVIDDSRISERNPKYLFPSERERSGQLLQFKKSLFLYNAYRITKPVRDLVVVEGVASTWWLWQNGVDAVVAVMGSSCSAEQGALIVKLVEPKGCVWIFTDGDDAGRRCAGSVFLHIADQRFTRYVICEEGKQPTDWLPEDILGSFSVFTDGGAPSKSTAESGTGDGDKAHQVQQ
jgi:DNA primase